MALTHFTFGQAGRHWQGSQIPAMLSISFSSEGIVPSGSNQQTTATAGTDTGTAHVCRVATDTAVYVSFGSSPDATTAATRAFLPANAIEYFIVPASAKAAVVTI
jgi:hypothetical protein